ncbi:MAG: TlpA family protein disulfide reductase [Saprospiraceae bacterium]|nr:TlpA family protein disulfide reductase [Saprospiraceae bacterium]
MNFSKQIALKEYEFGITHLNSVINLFNILNIQRHLGNDTAKYLFNSLSIQVRSHSKAPEVRYKLFDLDSNIQIQNSAPQFSQSDNNSKIFSLSDYKGKYILLDFWASWCGPCRAENPNMLKAYKKYKKWGFEIIGISLDVDKRKWIQAIKEDNLPWKQVSDLKGGENKVALLYGIESIPMNFLIDPNGIIIAKNPRGEDLEAFLKTVIKQKIK